MVVVRGVFGPMAVRPLGGGALMRGAEIRGAAGIGTDPAQRDQAAREARQHAAEALIEGDALVRGLLAQYPGARIVPGSVAPL